MEVLRKELNTAKPEEVTESIIELFSATRTNAEFIDKMLAKYSL